MEIISGFLIPGLILLVVVAFFVVMWAASKRYKKIPPGMIGIFYGREYTSVDPADSSKKIKRGFRVMSSGGKILMPLVESYQELSTNVFQIDINEQKIPNDENVPMSIKGIATCKIGPTPEEQMNAAESFLGQTEESMHEIIKNILTGHLRSIIGNMNIDELLRKRDEFNKRVIAESREEFKSLGIAVNLVITDVNDAEGFIDSLGKKAVAEAKKEADIKVAEANRDKEISVSNALKEAELVKNENEALIANAEKEKTIKQSQYKVESDTKLAEANMALNIASAKQETILVTEQAIRDAKQNESQIEVQKKAAELKEAELIATVIKPAEAAKEKIIIEANAKKETGIIEADLEAKVKVTKATGESDAKIKAAEGESSSITKIATANKEKSKLEGEGAASIVEANLLATAKGNEAMLLAEAKGNEAKLLAEAKGTEANLMALAKGESEKIKLKLLGEAEGTEKLAEALKKMDDRAQLMLILEKLPAIIEITGEAGSRVAEAIFKSVAMPLGNIDSLNIMDMGGSGSGIDKVSSIVPNLVAKVFAGLSTSGFDISDVLKKIGIDPSAFQKLLGNVSLKKNADDSDTAVKTSNVEKNN